MGEETEGGGGGGGGVQVERADWNLMYFPYRQCRAAHVHVQPVHTYVHAYACLPALSQY